MDFFLQSIDAFWTTSENELSGSRTAGVVETSISGKKRQVQAC